MLMETLKCMCTHPLAAHGHFYAASIVLVMDAVIIIMSS